MGKYTETSNHQQVCRVNGSSFQSFIKKIETSIDGNIQTGEALDPLTNQTVKVYRNFKSSIGSIWTETAGPDDKRVLLTNYVNSLETIAKMPIAAQDFIAAQAEKIVLIKLQLRKAGYKPVFHGSWWDLEPCDNHYNFLQAEGSN